MPSGGQVKIPTDYQALGDSIAGTAMESSSSDKPIAAQQEADSAATNPIEI